MSSFTKWFMGLALITVAPLGVAETTGDLVAGKKKAVSCVGCHGEDGDAKVATYPKLAGQHASYIIKQLKEFKSGKRQLKKYGADGKFDPEFAKKAPDVAMIAIAKGLSEQEMVNLAAYYSAQKDKTTFGTSDPKLIGLGRKVYEGGNPKTNVPACIGCHSPTGSGNAPANFPMLSGQNAGYTAAQLRAFREAARVGAKATSLGKTVKKSELPGRHNDKNRMMRAVVANMSDAEIDAVANYISTLKANPPQSDKKK